MGYYVSRQHYWHDGTRAVEIVSGSSDNASADMLTPFYRAEGEDDTYDDPREAAQAAIRVRNAWVKDVPYGADDAHGVIITGFTTGYGMVVPEEVSDEELMTWAEEEYQKLPKCGHCGRLLGHDCYGNEFTTADNEYPFCSEYCADMAAREFLDSITTAVHCTACDAMLPKDTLGWCDICGADFMTLERVYE
jgi:hypothetical protein